MSNCKNCGRPLIISEGKCVYCGFSVQRKSDSGGARSGIPRTPWYKKLNLSLKAEGGSWITRLLRKCLIAIMIALVLATIAVLIHPWPGCLISIELLLLAMVLGVSSIVVLQPEITEDMVEEVGESKASTTLNHILTLILIWGFFFSVLGLLLWAFGAEWWSLLIAEIIGSVGLLVMLFVGFQAISDYF